MAIIVTPFLVEVLLNEVDFLASCFNLIHARNRRLILQGRHIVLLSAHILRNYSFNHRFSFNKYIFSV